MAHKDSQLARARVVHPQGPTLRVAHLERMADHDRTSQMQQMDAGEDHGDGNRANSNVDACDRESVRIVAGVRAPSNQPVNGNAMRLLDKKSVNESGMRRASGAEQYESEMIRIKVALSAGLDPTVCLQFVAFHAQRSPATLYRVMASGRLPKPTKVGRSSRWRFSDIELYRGGTSSNQERV